MTAYYYNTNAEGRDPRVVDKNWVTYYGGIDPNDSTPEELSELGFYLYSPPTPPKYNPHIFSLRGEIVINGNNANGIFSIEPLPLENSKGFYLNEVNSKAYTLLQPSDWVVVRQTETGLEAPTNVTTWRESVRTEAQSKRDLIAECNSPENLDIYVSSEAYSWWPTPS